MHGNVSWKNAVSHQCILISFDLLGFFSRFGQSQMTDCIWEMSRKIGKWGELLDVDMMFLKVDMVDHPQMCNYVFTCF